MSVAPNFELMARYNQWMNGKIFAAASGLSDAENREDLGAFFKSILGTLNHLLVADTIWLKRFARHRAAYKALKFLDEVRDPTALNAIVHDDLADLWNARQIYDDAIIRWTAQIDPEDLNCDLIYTNTKGDPFKDNFGNLLQHYFNHQTHHRGQITTLLSQKGIDIGSTDLLHLIRK